MRADRKISARDLESLLENDSATCSAHDKTFIDHINRIISHKELQKVIDEVGATPDEPEIETTLVNGGGEIDDKEDYTLKELQKLVDNRAAEKKAAVIDDFIGKLTLHGYPQFHDSTGIRKVLWAIVLLTMTGLIIHLGAMSYSPENRYKQIIELLTKKVDKIDFPTITICMYSPVLPRDAHKRFPVNITEDEFKTFYRRVLSNRREEEYVNDETTKRILKGLREKGYTTYTSILQLFELNEEFDINSEFVRTIMRRNRCIYEDKPCDFKKDFKRVYRHTSQSLCLQFNYFEVTKPGRISTGNDIENGLSMYWDISGDHYFYDFGLHGLLMEIHPYATPHHLIDHRNAIYLEPGSCTNIDITEVDTQRLPPPFQPACGESEMDVVKGFPYSQSICEADCYLSKIYETCGCIVDQFSEFVVNLTICEPEDMPCVFKASQETHCHACPTQCSAHHYDVMTSRLGIGNRMIKSFLSDNEDWKDKPDSEIVAYAKENIVGFRIGFRTLEKQLRNYVQAMPWFERISLLGGTIGLLMGLSLTTCFEFFFFCVDYSIIFIKHRCTRKHLSRMFRDSSMTC